jgi:hypothetical protein
MQAHVGTTFLQTCQGRLGASSFGQVCSCATILVLMVYCTAILCQPTDNAFKTRMSGKMKSALPLDIRCIQVSGYITKLLADAGTGRKEKRCLAVTVARVHRCTCIDQQLNHALHAFKGCHV